MFRTQFFTTSIRLLQTTKVQRAHSIIQADTFRSRFPAFMEDVRNSLSKSHPDICQGMGLHSSDILDTLCWIYFRYHRKSDEGVGVQCSPWETY